MIKKLIFRQSRQGVILVWMMLSVTILLGAIIAGLTVIQSTNASLESHMQYYGQASAMAKAGLLDCLAWFRRQTTQPVITFNPQRDMIALPPVNDTDDDAIGIVRELEVCQSADIWGRYEVDKTIVTDISSQRGMTSNGAIWYIESKGIIYVRRNAALNYNVYPNEVLGEIRLATEIRRVSIVLPGSSALCTGDPGQTNIGNNSKIRGMSQMGIVYPPAMGTPTIAGGATVTGTLGATSMVSPYNDECIDVFGMSEAELRAIADYYVSSIDDLPDPIPDYKIVYFEGNPSFNSSHPLKGTGIFYCTGNLNLAANSGSSYNGIIYAASNYVQAAPSMISGSVITKSLTQVLSTGDTAEIDYDASVINQVQTYTGQYRLAKGIYEVP